MDRAFDRAFSRVHGRIDSLIKDKTPDLKEASPALEARQADGGPSSTSAADDGNAAGGGGSDPQQQDAVKAILDAWRDKDYFRLMRLPRPTADELGRPVWSVDAADISRAYRKLSVLVHPDKVPGPHARSAFEALNATSRLLKGGGEPGSLEAVLKAEASKAVSAAAAEAGRVVDMADKVALAGQRLARSKELRKEEGRSFQSEIAAQMRKRQEDMLAARSRRPGREGGGRGGGGAGRLFHRRDDDDGGGGGCGSGSGGEGGEEELQAAGGTSAPQTAVAGKVQGSGLPISAGSAAATVASAPRVPPPPGFVAATAAARGSNAASRGSREQQTSNDEDSDGGGGAQLHLKKRKKPSFI